jgi:hypothetical protein
MEEGVFLSFHNAVDFNIWRRREVNNGEGKVNKRS